MSQELFRFGTLYCLCFTRFLGESRGSRSVLQYNWQKTAKYLNSLHIQKCIAFPRWVTVFLSLTELLFLLLKGRVFYLNRPNSSSTIKNTFRTMGWQTVKKLPGHFRKSLPFATRFHFYILLGNNTLWLSWPHKWQNWFETWILWACQIS